MNGNIPIIDPREEALAMAYHLGRDEHAKRDPIAPLLEAASDLRVAEIECLMNEVPA